MALQKANYKIGDVYGHWTIIGHASNYRHGQKRVLCKCKCGKEKVVMFTTIYTGKSSQCNSCANKERTRSRIGMKFNGLEVVDVTRGNGPDNTKILCHCGGTRWVPWGPLNAGRMKSCGLCSRRNNPRRKIYSSIPSIQLSELRAALEYDANKGTLTRIATTGDKEVKGEIIKSEFVYIKGRRIKTARVCYWLHTNRCPRKIVKFYDGDHSNIKFDNFYFGNAQASNGSTLEKVNIRGRIVVMEVDGSKPNQPKTEANKKRIAGECKGCKNYSRCGDLFFECECIGYDSDSDESQEYQSLLNVEAVNHSGVWG